MHENEASQIAGRIGKLWPTLNSEQIAEVARAMVRETVDFQTVDTAVSDLYAEASKFFDLSALTEKLRHARQSMIDPLSQPNSFESQAIQRARTVQQWHDAAMKLTHDRERFRSHPEAEQAQAIAAFKETPEYFAAREAYDFRFNRKQLPAGFIAWWNDASKVGAL